MNMESKQHGNIIRRVAAVDIGSNAMRLQIFDRESDGSISIANTVRKPVRLGRDVFHNGRILHETFDAAIAAMKEFKAVIAESGAAKTTAVATSAVREASNGAAFVERTLRETGIEIKMIGGSEEALLVITAVLDRMSLANRHAIHIEVGGGSVEVSFIDDAKIQFSMTHKLGAVRLMEVLNDYSNSSEDKFREIVREYVAVTQKRLRSSLRDLAIDRFVATGGNIDSLVWLLEETGWGRVEVENGVKRISYKTLVDTVKRLAMYSFRDRVEQLKLRPDRADVILPAALVYTGFAEMAHAEWIYAPGVGVRDGLAIEMFRNEEAGHQEARHGQIISSVMALGEKYEFDRTHAQIVAAYARELFDGLADLHGLGERERLLLEVASLLHDIGYFVGVSRHHKHSYYLISESDISGLSQRESLIVANIARYHRKAFPREQHENFGVLPPREKETILKLAAILRIADALDREHSKEKMAITIRQHKDKVEIGLPTQKEKSLELWAMASKAEMFAEVFGYNIELK